MSEGPYIAEHRVGRTWWGVRVPIPTGGHYWFDYSYKSDADVVALACNYAHAAALASLSAGAVDLTQFEGITPGEWSRSQGWEPTPSVVDTENIYGSQTSGVIAKVVRASQNGKYSSEKEANARAIAAVPKLIAEVKALRARVAAATEENRRMREAIQLRLDDWASVTSPGAAAEGCSDPEDVAAMKSALSPTPTEKKG